MYLTRYLPAALIIFFFAITLVPQSYAKPKKSQRTVQLKRNAKRKAALKANVPPPVKKQETYRPLLLVFGIALLTLAPFFIMLATSFLKISVVLSIVRTALGTPQIPPNQVITGLAIVLSIYTMMPVCIQIYEQFKVIEEQNPKILTFSTDDSVEEIYSSFINLQTPIKNFLYHHSHDAERTMFFSMSQRLTNNSTYIKSNDLVILVPAFAISELKEAFQIGFILFIPFLVIDLVVANLLMALGMQMLSPNTISLPFKLLLFVMIDGWHLITRGLIQGYVVP